MRYDRMNSSRAEEVNNWEERARVTVRSAWLCCQWWRRVISSNDADAHTTQTDTCCGMSEYSVDQPSSAKPPTNENLSSDPTFTRERSVTSHRAKASAASEDSLFIHRWVSTLDERLFECGSIRFLISSKNVEETTAIIYTNEASKIEKVKEREAKKQLWMSTLIYCSSFGFLLDFNGHVAKFFITW